MKKYNYTFTIEERLKYNREVAEVCTQMLETGEIPTTGNYQLTREQVQARLDETVRKINYLEKLQIKQEMRRLLARK